MRIIFPKEHGSWAILLIPFLIGAKIGGRFEIKTLIFLISVLALFLAYQSMVITAKSKLQISKERLKDAITSLFIFLPVVAISSYALLFYFKLYGLLTFGIVVIIAFLIQLYLSKLHLDKKIAGQLFSMAILVITAPSTYYVQTGKFDFITLKIYLLNLIFFGSGIIYVRMKISAIAGKKDKFTFREKIFIGKYNIAYHITILFLLIILFVKNSINFLMFTGFLPIIIHSLMGTFLLKKKVNFKKLGWTETIYSILFAVMVIIGFQK